MSESILTSIKKLIGIAEDDTSFDVDIIMHINSVFAILYQLGVDPQLFTIEDESTTWQDYLSDWTHLQLIKSYVAAKVRMIFDPPTGSVKDALEQTIKELEWRINAEVDFKEVVS